MNYVELCNKKAMKMGKLFFHVLQQFSSSFFFCGAMLPAYVFDFYEALNHFLFHSRSFLHFFFRLYVLLRAFFIAVRLNRKAFDFSINHFPSAV